MQRTGIRVPIWRGYREKQKELSFWAALTMYSQGYQTMEELGRRRPGYDNKILNFYRPWEFTKHISFDHIT